MELAMVMNPSTVDKTFDPLTLADDLLVVSRIYSHFFARLDETDWDKPVKGSLKEWTLHETIAHLRALNGQGLEGIEHTLRGDSFTFTDLDSRYEFNTFNRTGIDRHLHIPLKDLGVELFGIMEGASGIARNLLPDQVDLTLEMPIYNRPINIVEALSIFVVHTGLFHTAQVAEPADLQPLWLQLSPEIRHRMIGRTMRAFSLLYRSDIGGPLSDSIAFRVGGPGGGEWYVKFSPEDTASGEGTIEHPGLVIQMRDTAVFCRFVTGRLNIPIGLIRGNMKLRGDLRLFLRMATLFSVDARPKVATKHQLHPLPST
jgi:hypothetical protein